MATPFYKLNIAGSVSGNDYIVIDQPDATKASGFVTRRIRLGALIVFNGGSFVNPVITTTGSASGDFTTLTVAGQTVATLSAVAALYLTQANAASTYLTIANGASTYLTIANGASTYQTIANLANTADVALGDALSGVKRTNSGAVGATLHAWIEARDEFNLVGEFAALTDGSDQTAVVNTALASLGVNGGTVRVPTRCKFNLQNVVFPQRSNLEYRRDDDTSPARASGALGTSERVYWSANSSGTGAGQGIVNEPLHIEAAFNPGVIVNVRKDVTGHDAWLGPGQSRTNPARAYGLIVQDEQNTGLQVKYEAYPTYSLFSGICFQGSRRVYTLTGVGTGAGGWVATLPAAPDLITGVTSGATGQVISLSATETVLLWVSGVFAPGERLTNGSQTPTNTLSAAVYAETLFQPLGYDLTNGNWSMGLPYGSGKHLLNLGGVLALMPSRTFGQYIYETVTNPGLMWTDAIADVPTNGYRMLYDTAPAAASRRLWLYDFLGTTKLGPIGAVRAKASFSNSALVETSAINIATVVRTAGGKYTVTFTVNFTRADYAVSIGNGDIADNSRYKNIAVGSVEIWNYNAAGSLADLTGQVSVVCTAGDI